MSVAVVHAGVGADGIRDAVPLSGGIIAGDEYVDEPRSRQRSVVATVRRRLGTGCRLPGVSTTGGDYDGSVGLSDCVSSL